ncbi:MAG: S24/S26 family peptidase [Pseudomonadota bacterium]
MPGLILDTASLTELAGEVLALGGVFCFKTRGTSMKPFFTDDTVLYLKSAESVDLRRGDAVLYRQGGSAAVHRIVGFRESTGRTELLILGDACLGPPERIALNQVVGVVVGAVRDGRSIPLDHGAWRWAGTAWAVLAPLRVFVLRWGGVLLKAIRWRNGVWPTPAGKAGPTVSCPGKVSTTWEGPRMEVPVEEELFGNDHDSETR